MEQYKASGNMHTCVFFRAIKMKSRRLCSYFKVFFCTTCASSKRCNNKKKCLPKSQKYICNSPGGFRKAYQLFIASQYNFCNKPYTRPPITSATITFKRHNLYKNRPNHHCHRTTSMIKLLFTNFQYIPPLPEWLF